MTVRLLLMTQIHKAMRKVAIKEIWLRSTPAKGNRIEPILNEIGIAKATLNEVDGFKPNEQTSVLVLFDYYSLMVPLVFSASHL